MTEWTKSNTEPVTDDELHEWMKWAKTSEVCKTKTGNRVIRLIHTIQKLKETNQ